MATRVGVVGAAGKMGKTLVSLIAASDNLELAGAVEMPGSPALGLDAGEVAGLAALGISISDELSSVVADLDVLIDFTIAPATEAHLEICATSATRMVIGTTGLSQQQSDRLFEIGKTLPIVYATNYSVGVNATFQLVEMASSVFGDTVDVEIVESHHRHKVDAPSGTAITLGEHVAKGRNKNLAEVEVHGRHGITGERTDDEIAFHALRGGEIVGEHTVMFIGAGERLEITHRAQSRTNFAEGALRAASWICDQPAGVYNMMDVLGIRS